MHLEYADFHYGHYGQEVYYQTTFKAVEISKAKITNKFKTRV